MILSRTILPILLVAIIASTSVAQDQKNGKRRRQGNQAGSRTNQQDRAKRFENLVKRLDLNRDGEITADEIPENLANRLRRLDRNQDGKIDAGELRRARTSQSRANRANRTNDTNRGAQNRGQQDEGGQVVRNNTQQKKNRRNNKNQVQAMLKRLDTNNDNEISRQEARSAPRRIQQVLARLDLNSDDRLDASELQQLPAAIERAGDMKKRRNEDDAKPRGGVLPKHPGKIKRDSKS